MNANNNMFLEDQIKELLKEVNPAKLSEIVEDSKKLGDSIVEYLFDAHKVYKALREENKKGKLIVVLSHNPAPIKRENGKIYIDLGDGDKILNFKLKGLEHKYNGNGNGYHK